MRNNRLIVMMGPAGIGKSYIAEKIKENSEDTIIVSRDDIRFLLLEDGEEYFSHEDDVKQQYYDTINDMIQEHKMVIADATQITRRSRKKLFDSLIDLSNIYVMGIWIEGPIERAKKQNNQRTGRKVVPPKVIEQQYVYKTSPQLWEGFNELIFISQDSGLASSTNKINLRPIETMIKEIANGE